MPSKNFYLTSLAVAAAAMLPLSASAGLTFDASLHAPAQGFGTAPRDLTLQATGQTSFESGAVDYLGASGIGFGTAIDDSLVHDPNGVTNASGTAAMPNPLADNQKYGVPTAGSLGITTASQIGVLFNATEPSGNSINVLDVTLKFYNATGTLLGAINGEQNFASSNPGNGVAGFTFVVSSDEQAYVNDLLAAGGSGTTFALEAKLGDFSGGPESFLIYNLGASTPPVPEPGSYALLMGGLGVIGFVARRRKMK